LRSASDYCYEPSGEPFEPLANWFFQDPLHFTAREAFDGLFTAGAPIARALAPLGAASPPSSSSPSEPYSGSGISLSLPVVGLLGVLQLCTAVLAISHLRALLATRRTTATNPKSSGAWAHKSNESPKARAEAAMDESDFGGGFNMEMNEAAIAAAKASRRDNKA
jgi:hypothetical protein